MSSYKVYKCDRCGIESRDEGEFLVLPLPLLPSGHASRLDCWIKSDLRNLCKACATSYRE